MKLNNGVMLPQIALGVWQYDNDTAKNAIALAFQAGFTQIDTAEMYGNQVGTGEAIKTLLRGGMRRSDIFVTTKTLPCKLSTPDECYAQTLKDFEGDLTALDLDHVDLILLHAPSTGVHSGPCDDAACAINAAQWAAYTQMYKKGKARAIGVSNYCQSCIECLAKNSSIVPAVNQIQVHVGMGPDPAGLVSYGRSKGIITQAYSPLGNGKLPGDATLATIGKKYDKSGAQVALKWIVSKGMAVSTKAKSAAYLAEDVDLFSWDLSPADQKTLDESTQYPGNPCWACTE
jgi:diketogulonate reductase-like aldo/keto reductase